MLAVRRTTTPTLRIANVLSGLYGPASFPADPSQAVDVAHHSWGNYFLCGYKGVHDHLGLVADEPGAGMEVMVDGRVPTGSGLSSSSAFVCASALAVMAAKRLSFSQQALAELACVCERYCGTQSGGMDQAISIMGARGLAKVVHFNPVRTEDVHLPPGGVFVIANSLAVSNKAETAHTRYNLRVVECRAAAVLLGLKLGMPRQEALGLKTLRQLEAVCGGLLGCAAALETHLSSPGGALSFDSLTAALGCPVEELFAPSESSARSVLAHPQVRAAGLRLYERAKHVYAEAGRVAEFASVCAAEGGGGEDATLAALGALMDASHASCRDLYDCSCPELEELVGCAKRAGALGARLTGAGWGGCCVSLLPAAGVPAFLEALRTQFFAARLASGRLSQAELGSALFATKPGAGAALFEVRGEQA